MPRGDDTAAIERGSTPSIAEWVPRASEWTGYDIMAPKLHPLPDSLERLQAVVERLRGPKLTAEMLEPWADVVTEDLTDFEVTVSERWPDE